MTGDWSIKVMVSDWRTDIALKISQSKNNDLPHVAHILGGVEGEKHLGLSQHVTRTTIIVEKIKVIVLYRQLVSLVWNLFFLINEMANILPCFEKKIVEPRFIIQDMKKRVTSKSLGLTAKSCASTIFTLDAPLLEPAYCYWPRMRRHQSLNPVGPISRKRNHHH